MAHQGDDASSSCFKKQETDGEGIYASTESSDFRNPKTDHGLTLLPMDQLGIDWSTFGKPSSESSDSRIPQTDQGLTLLLTDQSGIDWSTFGEPSFDSEFLNWWDIRDPAALLESLCGDVGQVPTPADTPVHSSREITDETGSVLPVTPSSGSLSPVIGPNVNPNVHPVTLSSGSLGSGDVNPNVPSIPESLSSGDVSPDAPLSPESLSSDSVNSNVPSSPRSLSSGDFSPSVSQAQNLSQCSSCELLRNELAAEKSRVQQLEAELQAVRGNSNNAPTNASSPLLFGTPQLDFDNDVPQSNPFWVCCHMLMNGSPQQCQGLNREWLLNPADGGKWTKRIECIRCRRPNHSNRKYITDIEAKKKLAANTKKNSIKPRPKQLPPLPQTLLYPPPVLQGTQMVNSNVPQPMLQSTLWQTPLYTPPMLQGTKMVNINASPPTVLPTPFNDLPVIFTGPPNVQSHARTMSMPTLPATAPKSTVSKGCISLDQIDYRQWMGVTAPQMKLNLPKIQPYKSIYAMQPPKSDVPVSPIRKRASSSDLPSPTRKRTSSFDLSPSKKVKPFNVSTATQETLRLELKEAQKPWMSQPSPDNSLSGDGKNTDTASYDSLFEGVEYNEDEFYAHLQTELDAVLNPEH